MTTEFRVDIAIPAALIGDPARAAMLMSLMDGGRRAAGELAAIANVSAQAASGHLARLRDGEMVISEADGRRRFYRLASPDVAQAIEHLLALAPRTPPGTSKLTLLKPLRWARTCYDHLAGVIGVALHDYLFERELLSRTGGGRREYTTTRAGDRWFVRKLAIDPARLPKTRRPIARPCVDWTERSPHLAGALGAAMLRTFRARGWLLSLPPGRAVALSASGENALRAWGLRFDVAAGTTASAAKKARR